MIEAEKAHCPTVWMCQQLAVARSTFYAWLARAGTMTATAARRAELAARVEQIFSASRRTYGCRRIAAELNRCGTAVSVGLVADLMREQGLSAVQPRSWRRTTLPDVTAAPAPDRLGRDFTAAVPGDRLVGDITYLSTPGKAGCTWRSCSTWPPAWWSAGRSPSTWAPASSSTR